MIKTRDWYRDDELEREEFMNVEPDATSQCPKCQKWIGMVTRWSQGLTYMNVVIDEN